METIEISEFNEHKRKLAFLLKTRRDILTTIENINEEKDYDVEKITFDNIQKLFEKMKHIQHIPCSFPKLNELKCKIIKTLKAYMHVFNNYQFLYLFPAVDDIEFCSEEMMSRKSKMTEVLKSKTTRDRRFYEISTHVEKAIHDYDEFWIMKRNVVHVTRIILSKIKTNFINFCKIQKGVDEVNEDQYEEATIAWEKEKMKPIADLGTRWMETDEEATISFDAMYPESVERLRTALNDENEYNAPPYYQIREVILPYESSSKRRPGDIIEVGDKNYKLLAGKPIIEWFCLQKGIEVENFKKYLEYKKCIKNLMKRTELIEGMTEFKFSRHDLNILAKTANTLEKLFSSKEYMSLYPSFFENDDAQQMWTKYLEFVNCMKAYVTKENELHMTSCVFQINEES